MKLKYLIISIVVLILVAGVTTGAILYFGQEQSSIIDKVALQPELKTVVPFDQWQKDWQAQVAQAKQEANEEFTVFMGGDIMLSRNVESKMIAKNDFSYCFVDIRKLVQSADLAVANLESPIYPGKVVPTGSFNFRANPKSNESLQLAGFDAMALANNHFGNMGKDGMTNTFNSLTEKGLDYFGAGENLEQMKNPLIRDVKGGKVALLEYAYGPDNYEATVKLPGMALMDTEQLLLDLQEAKDGGATTILVFMHAGTEYVNDPNDQQTEFAHLAIDNGATMVIGHHPHVVQKMEIYKDKYIFYSLGNLIFDQMWSQDTREGLTLLVTFNKEGVKKIDYYPVVIEDYCRPRFVTGEEADTILGKLK